MRKNPHHLVAGDSSPTEGIFEWDTFRNATSATAGPGSADLMNPNPISIMFIRCHFLQDVSDKINLRGFLLTGGWVRGVQIS
jgi:hypothetical protein